MKPSFGTMIRARRLGWGLSNRHGGFIRMSDADGSNSLIEFCPIHEVPSKKRGYHRCWWEGGDGILDMIPWLRFVRCIKRYFGVLVDDNGMILREVK